MVISDETVAVRVLETVNYYRLTGYALQFREDPKYSTYLEETTFESIYHLYLVDERLRDLFRMYIEKAEIYYRTQIAYGFASVKCTEPPYDQHYDDQNFYNKVGYHEVLDHFEREKNYYKDSLIVKHHKIKYANKMPLWVMVELMSFSNLSKLYSAMYFSEKDVIAQSIGVGRDTLENHLHCLAVLRNNSLFAYALVLLKRLPDPKSKRGLLTVIENVIEEYKEDIDMKLIGFPNNYIDILKNNIT